MGAPSGLSELVPGALNGSSAAAADLIFDYGNEYVVGARADGFKVVLRRNPSSPFTAEQLASAVRYKGLVSARALDSGHIEVVLSDAASATRVGQLADAMFDLGPFAFESQSDGRVRLRRRGNSAIDVIEIVQVSSSDEWRKFLARELDVMSSSPSLYRDQFAGMTSVRLLDIPPIGSAILFFNVRDTLLADTAVRRRIAAALNRRAIARVACGDPSSAGPSIANGPDKEPALPKHLSLLVVEDESTLLLAASVVRHQLAALGIAVEVEPLPLEEMLQNRISKGLSQLFLAPAPNGERRLARFLSPGPGRLYMTGLSDAEYDDAVAAGDVDRAQAILDREMPATVLYEWRTFAAIDARFCGEVTPSLGSWSWMADLYPCENGEGEGKDTP